MSFLERFFIEDYSFSPYNTYNECIEDIMYITEKKLDLSLKECTINEVIQIEKVINKKLSLTNNSETFPIFNLRKVFYIDDLQLHTILVALLYSKSYKYGEKYSSLSNKFIVCNILTCINSYPYKTENKLWFESYDNTFLNTFFEKPKYSHSSLFEMSLSLKREIINYILGYKLDLPVYMKYLINKSNTEPIYKSIDNCIFNIYGEIGSGRGYFIKNKLYSNFNILSFSFNEFITYSENKNISNEIFYPLYLICKLYDFKLCICDIDINNIDNETLSVLIILFKRLLKYLGSFSIISNSKINSQNSILQELNIIQIKPELPDLKEQLNIWNEFTKDIPKEENINFEEITNIYNLTPYKIKSAINKALYLNNGKLSKNSILEGCENSFTKLLDLGLVRINTSLNWEHLILPKNQKNILKHACNYMNYNYKIYEKWNFKTKFSYGKNLSILMEGAPGTGKTMSACIIGKEIGLPIFQLNTAKIVSKYIGETEKNINTIFDYVEKSNAILFIDEMDTLFSKRTEIKDSHDKYANMETSFLLQKIESYKGVLLLATNFINNIDEAFIRRIKFIVHFSLPEKDERLKIWQSIYPSKVPLDNNIDFDFLATQFKLSGGEIKNIAVKSAFISSYKNEKINMTNILLAIKNEFDKKGKILLSSDLGQYEYLLKNLYSK